MVTSGIVIAGIMPYQAFCENPLLLTIMLMTYEQDIAIPLRMRTFFGAAFFALSEKHDASKGSFERRMKTGLTVTRFVDYFSEFCARTYCDGIYEMDGIQIYTYFNAMHEKAKDPDTITAADFTTDIVENLCLMTDHDGVYRFIHRSFQEFFSVMYFVKADDKCLNAIGMFFDNRKEYSDSDVTFNLLYDLIPERIERNVFIPFLEDLFCKCVEEEGLQTFMKRTKESFLLKFLIEKENLTGSAPEEQYQRLAIYLEEIKSKTKTPGEDLFALFA